MTLDLDLLSLSQPYPNTHTHTHTHTHLQTYKWSLKSNIHITHYTYMGNFLSFTFPLSCKFHHKK